MDPNASQMVLNAEWQPLSPLVAATLDDPETGLIIYDEQLRLIHATSQLYTLLGVTGDEQPRGSAELNDLLSRTALDRESLALARTTVQQATDSSASEPVVLSSRDGARHIRMKVRTIGSQYRVASFNSLNYPSGVTVTEYGSRDSLTGLLSRRHFEDAVTAALRNTSDGPVAVMLLDLDRFKAVNDTLGHAAGDAVLRLAAERLRTCVRATDLIARLGGDEFAILLYPAQTPADSETIAQRILDVVQRTYLIEGHLVNIGVSIGIASSPDHGTTRDLLLRNADLALYQSKTSGRGTYRFFDTAMETRAQMRRTNELELRRALALRQLELHYQPQVDLHTGRLIGFEALLRWRHPEKGLIPPSSFLPLAEEIGVIIPIGEWVLRTACEQAMKWPDDVVIAVNASPLQFDTGRFATTVSQALRSTGLPGARLEIEITEGILLRSEESVLATLYALRAMGVRIAMDDFGTGYASLSQLAHFPFDKIKIDRSLSGSEGDNPKRRAIIRAIAALGNSLGVSTMAEGVETLDQLSRLEADGCSAVQGFYFGKPVPSSELDAVICRINSSNLKSV